MAARARFGITVTRKVGNAVARNRIKRVVRESCRRVGDLFPGGVDVVVVARASAVDAGVAETVAELSLLARRLGAKSPGRNGDKSGSAGAGGSAGGGG
jgi:ribonuclease P protein component